MNFTYLKSSSTIQVIGLLLLVYCIQFYIVPLFSITPHSSEWISYFTVSYSTAFSFRLFSSLVSHANLFHLIDNVVLLFFAGIFIEYVYSRRMYWLIILLSGLSSSAAMLLLYGYLGITNHILGSSGIVCGLMGVCIAVIPRRNQFAITESYINLIHLWVWLFGILIVIGSLAIMVFIHPTYLNMGHLAHSTGIIIGFCIGVYKPPSSTVDPAAIDNHIHSLFVLIFGSKNT